MVKERPLRDLLKAIERRKPFTLSRWGEHEWHCLFGERNGFLPKDGHWYFPSLCTDLTKVLQERPAYTLGLPAAAEAKFGTRIADYIDGCGLTDLDWAGNALKVEDFEQLMWLVGAVSRVPLLVVGPPHLHRAKSVLQYRAFVDVPPRHSYLCGEDIVRNVLAALDDFKTPALVSVSAGVVAPLVIDALYRKVGHRHQLVDFGGLWEPFAGKP